MPPSKSVDPKYQLVADAHQWAINKLSAGEHFQGLLVSNHPSGKMMTKYDFATVEEAIARCERELSNELSDATEYAFVYDALFKQGESTVPVLVFRMEGQGAADAAQFVQRYQVKKKFLSSTLAYKALEEFQPMAAGRRWLR
jgi:hypothetical protein